MIHKYKYELMLLTTAAIWGLTFPAMKYIGHDIDSVTFLAVRFTIAAFMLLYICRKQLKKISHSMLVFSVSIGLLYAFHSFLQTEGLRYTSPANSSFITSTSVVYVPLFSLLLQKLKINRKLIWTLLLVIPGFLLISGLLSVTPFAWNSSKLNKGDLLTLLCAVFTALYFVLLNMCTAKYDEVTVNLIHMFGAALGMWAMWLFYPDKHIVLTDTISVLGVLYCGIFGSAVGFLLLAKGQANLEPSKVSIICSLEAVFATLFAAIIPGRNGSVDSLTVESFLGGALILAGVMIITVKQKEQ